MPLVPKCLLHAMEFKAFYFLTQEDQLTKVPKRMDFLLGNVQGGEDKAGLEVLGRCHQSVPNQ